MSNLSTDADMRAQPIFAEADATRQKSDQKAFYTAFACLAVAAVFLQKFAVPLPAGELGINTAILLATLFWLFLRGIVFLDVRRLALFSLSLACAFTGILLNQQPFNLMSFGLLFILYFSFCFRFFSDEETIKKCLLFFQKIMIIVSVIVLTQQALQYTVGSEYWINLDKIFPPLLLYDGFMYIRPYEWGSPYLRPNAVFFLEPSVVSYYLAGSVVLELIWFRRIKAIAILVAGVLAVTASTGPLMLLVISPFLLAAIGRRYAAIVIIAATLLLAAAFAAGILNPFLSRIGELSQTGSSGFVRLVAPLQTIIETAADPAVSIFYGQGPGTSATNDFALQWPFSKLLTEYGFVTALSFHFFMVYAIFQRPMSRVLALAVFIPHAFFGGAFLSHGNVMPLVLLCTLMSHKTIKAITKPALNPLPHQIQNDNRSARPGTT